ncbi:hypothetical protein [Microbacterium sp. 22242]|uniref:hypothetical protein n=1 Tax=Microbacterium sp. 22242 TaxID=3453896 RepID=UPI003F826348
MLRGALAAMPVKTGLVHLRDLPRRSLAAGGGHVREICGSRGARNQLEWQLQVVELRGPVGVLALAPDSAHLIAGTSGPQVEVGPGASAGAPLVGLRKERVLPFSGAVVEFRRPRLRAAELSRIVVLSFVAPRATPQLVFADLHGTSVLPDGVQAIVVRSGTVVAAGETATALDAIVLAPGGERTVQAEDARVLLFLG